MGGTLGGGKPKTQSQTQPAIGALRVQQSAYGLVVPMVYGTNRLAGNLIDYCDFTAIAHQSGGQSSGSKGGGGGGGGGSTSYTYSCSLAIGLCGGVIQGIGTVWQAKSTTSVAALGAAVFTGALGQAPWSYMASRHPERAVGYSGLAYVAIPNLDLGDDANLPNFTFEVRGPLQFGSGIVDAAPWHIIPDFLAQADWPAEAIGDLTAYAAYCRAMGLFISPVLTEQRPANEILQEWAETTNAEFLDSEGKLKLIPYGDVEVTGNGVTYYPAITPAYDLGIDDFFPDEGEPPVRCPTRDLADAYNQITVEFVNRANGYNVQPVTAEDPAHIEIYGLRAAPVVKAHHITDVRIAQKVANLRLTRQLYSRTKFGFYLGWRHSRLEPGDYVTLTEPRLFLDRELVRLTRVVEAEDGRREIEAEEVPGSIAAPALYPSPHVSAYSVDRNVTAGNANPPVLFEPPEPLTDTGLEVWMAVSGGDLWGGCDVWVSMDGDSYKRAGVVSGGARHGVLAAPLIGTAGPLSVDLSVSAGKLLSGTAEEAAALATLCYAGGELLAYQAATLTGANRYDLGGLVRGAYGSEIKLHQAGAPFVRIDGALFKYPVKPEHIGKTIKVKLLSFNVWHGGLQSLEDVEPYSYTVTGVAQTSPLPSISSISTTYVAGFLQLNWEPISSFRAVDYEIRRGEAVATAEVLGRTPLTKFPASGDGTYWVAAHFTAASGVEAYSLSWAKVTVAGAALVQNVVASFDEVALGWPGEVSGGAMVQDGAVFLAGSGDILTAPDFLAIKDVLWYGGVAPSGIYSVPEAHQVHLSAPSPCNVALSVSVRGQAIYDNVLAAPDFLALADILGVAQGAKVKAVPQIRIAGADGVWGEWQDYYPGTYVGQHFDARVLLSSLDPQVTPLLDGFIFAVDVPDRTEPYTGLTVPAEGLDLVYSAPFNGGPNGAAVPHLQYSLINAPSGAELLITNQTLAGCHLQIVAGGVPVASIVNVLPQGY